MNLGEATEISVAAATLGLAASTAWMARRTGEVAKQTKREAEAVAEQVAVANKQVAIANNTFRASLRPWLTAGAPNRPPNAAANYGNFVVSVELRNVGNGLALFKDARIRAFDRVGDLVAYPNTPRFEKPALPVGEAGAVTFLVTPQSRGEAGLTLDQFLNRPNTFGHFYVDVLFTDAEGKQPTWAEVHATIDEHAAWRLHQIEHRREGEEEPFALSTF